MVTTEESTLRAGEVAWVAGHVRDLEADFLRFYREEDMLTLPGPRWLRLASRLPAYPGVMAARVEGILAAQDPAPSTPSARTHAPGGREARSSQGDMVREIAPTPEAIGRSALADVIEMG